MDDKKVAIILVAAGRGERARRADGDDRGPKQYQLIGEQSIIRHTIETFCKHPSVDYVLPVIHQDDDALFKAALTSFSDPRLLPPAIGGASRQASVYNGLLELKDHGIDWVLVHDGVRPFVSHQTIDRVLQGLQSHSAILPAMAVVDTIKRVKNSDTRPLIIEETVDRSTLWAAQTPQGFHFNTLLTAHHDAPPHQFSDDCAVMEAAGHIVHIVEGNAENFKITTADDIEAAKQKVRAKRQMETRVGNGFDVHAFEEGDAIILGGISIPHTKKLKGHSDADVGLHTLTDAIYGALGDGDIGSHFPPSEEKWKGAASDQFLIHACKRVKERGGRVVHLDLTIMCEMPKIGPHREAMRAEIARICELPLGRVAVKATTTERLGFTGREEGIAALATATIELPFEEYA